MSPPPSPPAPEDRLFDAGTLEQAEDAPAHSHVRWLCLSEDEEARALRRVLEHCWEHAGHSRDTLRKGLMNPRWGQHAGARAQLLALGLFLHEGYRVRSEPSIGKQSPDLLVEREGFLSVVEVRAITGCGETPWDRAPDASELPPPTPAGGGGDRATEGARRAARARARKLAARRAEAAATEAAELREVVVRVLEKKADAYRELCTSEDIAYLICIYEDTDRQLSPMVRDWAFGPSHDQHAGDQGALAAEGARFAHVSGVVVFGRVADERGRFLMRGDLILNPFAQRPLPDGRPLPHLRTFRLARHASPPCVEREAAVTQAFGLGPPA